MQPRNAHRPVSLARQRARSRAPLYGAFLAPLVAACGSDRRQEASPAPVPAAAAVEVAPAVEPATVPGPRIAFDAPEFDFGSVSDVEPLQHAFAFRNAGDQRLVVTEVKASCGCTTTTLAKTTYEPGETGTIETEWDPTGFGQQKKTITVSTNAGHDQTILSLTAQIDPFVALDPPYFSFIRVKLGTEHTLSASLRCSDPELEILGLTCTNAHVVPRMSGDAASGRTLEVKLLPSAPWGSLTAQVKLDVRGRLAPGAEPTRHSVDVGVSAQLFGEVELDRTLFAVGRVDPGAAFTAEVQVTRSSGEPFEILAVRIDQPIPSTMSVCVEPLAEKAKNGHRLIVSGEAGGHLGAVRGSVVFQTDVPGEPERTIPVMGLVRALEQHAQH